MLPTTVYDNAKVRRRSQILVMTQSLKNKGHRFNCGSCGTGGLLGLLMAVGLLYLVILHSSDRARPLRSLQGLSLHNANGEESLATKEDAGTLSSQRRLERRPPRLPPRIKFFGEDISRSVSLNHTEESDHIHVVQQKTSINLLWENRQVKVVEAFRHAWNGYKSYALGYDELKPISHSGEDGLGGLGATVVDALDTAIIMGLDDVVRESGIWIEENLQARIETKGQVNLFETTIRVLGGLLSAYHLSGGSNSTSEVMIHTPGLKPEVYLERAKALADKLLLAFTASPTAIPFSDVVLKSSSAHPAFGDGGASSTSEATTLQLEFGYLSEVSGDAKYGAAAMNVLQHFKDLPKTDGLVPIYINPHTGHFHGENIRLGSRGDSYYEYLLKVWLRQGGAISNEKSISFLREMYDEAMEGVKRHLVRTSFPKGLRFVGELPSGFSGGFSPKMDHLVCFLAGNLALGATRGLTKQEAINKGLFNAHDVENFQLAEDLAKTCYEMYAVTATGLAPEIAYFHMDGEYPQELGGGNMDAEFKEDIIIHLRDRHNLLRPETLESLFILYRITGDSKYRDWGWKIFQAFELHTKVESGGFSSLNDVTTVPAPKRDKMETFFLGETLKYLYLLFGDASVLPLDKYVFNTEAHPLPIASMGAAGVQ